MKVIVEIDCTPLEARQFLGLPDVQPMQAAMLAEMEKSMLAQVERFSPEALMKTWFSGVPQNAEWVSQIFGKLFAQGGTEARDAGSTKGQPKT